MVLLTTEPRPRALEAGDGAVLPGRHEESFAPLREPDAVAFCRARGLRGAPSRIVAVCARYGHHPLCLRLLAGLVATDEDRAGDIAVADGWEHGGPLASRQTQLLELACSQLHRPDPGANRRPTHHSLPICQ